MSWWTNVLMDKCPDEQIYKFLMCKCGMDNFPFVQMSWWAIVQRANVLGDKIDFLYHTNFVILVFICFLRIENTSKNVREAVRSTKNNCATSRWRSQLVLSFAELCCVFLAAKNDLYFLRETKRKLELMRIVHFSILTNIFWSFKSR